MPRTNSAEPIQRSREVRRLFRDVAADWLMDSITPNELQGQPPLVAVSITSEVRGRKSEVSVVILMRKGTSDIAVSLDGLRHSLCVGHVGKKNDA